MERDGRLRGSASPGGTHGEYRLSGEEPVDISAAVIGPDEGCRGVEPRDHTHQSARFVSSNQVALGDDDDIRGRDLPGAFGKVGDGCLAAHRVDGSDRLVDAIAATE